MSIKEVIICKGCKDSTTVEKDHHYCHACQEDIDRITKCKEISTEVKQYAIDNYTAYLTWMIKQDEKPEYKANYHTFMETCKDFFDSNQCNEENDTF
jgi:hypothetical protein